MSFDGEYSLVIINPHVPRPRAHARRRWGDHTRERVDWQGRTHGEWLTRCGVVCDDYVIRNAGDEDVWVPWSASIDLKAEHALSFAVPCKRCFPDGDAK